MTIDQAEKVMGKRLMAHVKLSAEDLLPGDCESLRGPAATLFIPAGVQLPLGHVRAAVDRNLKFVVRDVSEAQDWKCADCGKVRALSGHHRTPRSRGRNDRPENIMALCQDCHKDRHRRNILGE